MDHFSVTPEIFRDLCYRALEIVRSHEQVYRAILCPLRGGFYLSYFMNRHLNLPILYIEISSYSGRIQKEFQIGLKPDLPPGRYLLCDDIYDSGNTIKRIHAMFPHVVFDTVCLLTKVPDPTIWSAMELKADQWVDFFWEVM